MARRGEAGRALGMSAVASAVGGIFSVVVLIVAAPLLARLAYQFGPPEYFALALFGLSMVAAVGGDPRPRTCWAAPRAVLLATHRPGPHHRRRALHVRRACAHGRHRLSFRSWWGLFAISELFERMAQRGVVQEYIKLTAMNLPTLADFRKCGKAITLSSVIGTFIGILPGARATTRRAHLLQRDQALVEAQGRVGKGAIEGVGRPPRPQQRRGRPARWCHAGTRHPGQHHHRDHPRRPHDPGRAPGPHLFNEQPTLLYVVFGSMLACNLLYLVLGFVFAKAFARITLIPDATSGPRCFILSVVGAYAPNQSMVDVVVMLAFGVVGFLFKRYGFSPAPLIMGLVLGKMVEETLKQSLLLFDQDWTLFFVRPVVVVLFAITAAGLLAPPLWRAWQRMHRKPQLQ
jgi:putative tricarboxylic transport membrane protein